MPTTGYCHDCGLWVYVSSDWSCPTGHPAARVNGWYDSDTGQPVLPPAPPSLRGAEPVAPAGTRAAFLTDLLSTLGQNHAYCAGWGPDTDVIIASNPVDPSWGTGDKKAAYNAVLKVIELDRTVYFWESLEEKGDARAPDVGDATDATDGERSGQKRERAIGPGSPSWEMGYGTLLGVVEEIAARHGFVVQVAMSREAAVW